MSIEESGGLIQDLIYDKNGVRIRLQGSNLFKPGEITINPASAMALGKLGVILQNSKRKIVIEGHTDNEKFSSGNIASNWELGALRATAIVRFYIDGFNIPQDKISAMSYGDTHPISDNSTAEGRAENRRIEIFVQADKPL